MCNNYWQSGKMYKCKNAYIKNIYKKKSTSVSLHHFTSTSSTKACTVLDACILNGSTPVQLTCVFVEKKILILNFVLLCPIIIIQSSLHNLQYRVVPFKIWITIKVPIFYKVKITIFKELLPKRWHIHFNSNRFGIIFQNQNQWVSAPSDAKWASE